MGNNVSFDKVCEVCIVCLHRHLVFHHLLVHMEVRMKNNLKKK